jgi:hypothetical protein
MAGLEWNIEADSLVLQFPTRNVFRACAVHIRLRTRDNLFHDV